MCSKVVYKYYVVFSSSTEVLRRVFVEVEACPPAGTSPYIVRGTASRNATIPHMMRARGGFLITR